VFAAAVQSRRENARIVEHQAIARVKIAGEIAKHAIFPRAFVAIDYQHARCGAVGERFLRDQFFGEFVIKFGKEHLSLR
jgi:hypothetical protein